MLALVAAFSVGSVYQLNNLRKSIPKSSPSFQVESDLKDSVNDLEKKVGVSSSTVKSEDTTEYVDMTKILSPFYRN